MFLVCGEALYDLFLTANYGPAALTFDARAGGSPFNVAIGLARQGAASGLLTGASEDLLGRRLVEVLENEGVETRYLVRSGRRTTLSLVDLSTSGAPSYAFYGLGSADTALTAEVLPTIGPEVKALHFGSYSIAVAPVADAFAALAQAERSRFVSLDPNVRPTVLSDMAVWRRRIEGLLPNVDLLKVSAEDLAMLYPDTAHEEIAERYLAAGPKLVVITDGGEAVTGFRAGEKLTVAPPEVVVVDTVGAGDSFQAALLADLAVAGVLEGGIEDLDSAALRGMLQRAAEVAAVTCTRRGADMPRRETGRS